MPSTPSSFSIPHPPFTNILVCKHYQTNYPKHRIFFIYQIDSYSLLRPFLTSYFLQILSNLWIITKTFYSLISQNHPHCFLLLWTKLSIYFQNVSFPILCSEHFNSNFNLNRCNFYSFNYHIFSFPLLSLKTVIWNQI